MRTDAGHWLRIQLRFAPARRDLDEVTGTQPTPSHGQPRPRRGPPARVLRGHHRAAQSTLTNPQADGSPSTLAPGARTASMPWPVPGDALARVGM